MAMPRPVSAARKHLCDHGRRLAAKLKLKLPALGGLEKLPAVFTRKLVELNGSDLDLDQPHPVSCALFGQRLAFIRAIGC